MYSTTYNFTYGVFDLRTGVSVGSQSLASYTYSNDRRYNLQRLDYGNNDSVQYEYDDEERLIKQTYEDGAYVTYTYDNSGELVKVYDSQSGITTKYTYDLSGRTVKVTESGTGHNLSVTYAYDEENNLEEQVETVNGTTHIYEYLYDDDNRITKQTVDGVETTYTYDTFGRLTGKTVKASDTTNTTVTQDTYAFTTNGNATSGQVATVTQNGVTYTYTYDGNGNILSILDGTNTTSYVYDGANQLIRENNQAGGFTHTWVYNSAGNITERKEYAYTTGDLTDITPTDTVNYTYGNTNWGDLLTAYDGQALTYDEIGNLLNDGEWTYTWKHGRQLATASRNGITWNYTYDANGLRTKKDCGVLTYTYVYDGSQLTEMSFYTDLFKFTYDAGGTPLTVDYNGTIYYYVTNLQGDVITILNTSKQPVVQYTYDAWGKVLSVTGSMVSTLGLRNPLRYRGYVYDQETYLYYLQSRYYDPEWGRFINADAYAATGQGFVGNNMFAYCGNNPINRCDTKGDLWELIAAGAIAAVISGISNAVNTAQSGGSKQECLVAGVAGLIGGATGFAVAVATNFSPLGNLAARATTTIISDLGTSLVLNGEITADDIAYTAVDTFMDVCYSTVAYYYNPVESIVPQTAINAIVDGVIDYAETKLYFSPHPTSAEIMRIKKLTFMERRLAK